jgi:hypothetical protein
MKNQSLEPSYEDVAELMAAGCPIDFPNALPRHSFRAEQLPGYVESCVYALGPLDTGYVIPLRLATDRPSGTITTEWTFELPWQDHRINWEDYGPDDVIPIKDRDKYKSLINPRLMEVLKGDRLILRGHPVSGVLCGRSYQPIGESSRGVISAKLSFTDDLGNTVRLPIDLNIERLSLSSANRLPVRRVGWLLRRHPVESERRPVLARPIEALIAGEQAQAQMQSGLEAL